MKCISEGKFMINYLELANKYIREPCYFLGCLTEGALVLFDHRLSPIQKGIGIISNGAAAAVCIADLSMNGKDLTVKVIRLGVEFGRIISRWNCYPPPGSFTEIAFEDRRVVALRICEPLTFLVSDDFRVIVPYLLDLPQLIEILPRFLNSFGVSPLIYRVGNAVTEANGRLKRVVLERLSLGSSALSQVVRRINALFMPLVSTH